MVACSAKVFSLVGLAVTNSVTTLFMRMSRTQTPAYFSSTAVVITEIAKLIACFSVIVSTRGFRGAISAIYCCFFVHYVDTLMLGVPSLLYIVNNVFMFKAISHLDAATFQLTYQIKILMAAVLSVVFLKKRLSTCQWMSILVLFMGILVVVSKGEDKNGTKVNLILPPLVSDGNQAVGAAPLIHDADSLQGMAHSDLVELVQQWQSRWATVAASSTVVAGAAAASAGQGGENSVARRRLTGFRSTAQSADSRSMAGGMFMYGGEVWEDWDEPVRAAGAQGAEDEEEDVYEGYARYDEGRGGGEVAGARRLVEARNEVQGKGQSTQGLAGKGKEGLKGEGLNRFKTASTALTARREAAMKSMQTATGMDEGTMIGIVAAFAGSFFSCAAGIYIEKVLKSASATSVRKNSQEGAFCGERGGRDALEQYC
jgi:drug/metabolite transporter (DMT)-like permease